MGYLIISILQVSLASELIDGVVDSASVEFGLSESGPFRLRPSTIKAKLEVVASSYVDCNFTDSFSGQYSDNEWSGKILGREASGWYAGGEWGGSAVGGAPISDGRYKSSGVVSANHAGAPVASVWVRTAGASGFYVGVAGCGVVEALVVGQSNCVGKFGGPSGPASPGNLYIGPAFSANYANKVGIEEPWIAAGHTLQRSCFSGTSVDEWSDFILGNVLNRVSINPNVTVWVHGEGDSKLQEKSVAYPGKVNQLFNRIEASQGPQSFVWPMLKVSNALPFADLTNAGMEDLAMSRDDLTIVYTLDLSRPDGTHYTHIDGGYYTLGERLLAPFEPLVD